MARPRSFDEDQVLDLAIDAFWQRGFEGTSVADLVAATGLQKGSLYNAFGDKESLFLAALERYQHGVETAIEDLLLGAETAADGIELWLQMLLQNCRGEAGRRGCFATNAVAERASTDAAVRKSIARHERRLRGLVADAVEAGQGAGQVRKDIDSEVLSGILWSFATGLRLAARRGAKRERVEAQVAALRQLIEP